MVVPFTFVETGLWRLCSVRYKHRTGFIQIIVTNFSLLKSASSYLHSPLVLDIREKKVVNQQYLSTLS